jgi:hypothetical protein
VVDGASIANAPISMNDIISANGLVPSSEATKPGSAPQRCRSGECYDDVGATSVEPAWRCGRCFPSYAAELGVWSSVSAAC